MGAVVTLFESIFPISVILLPFFFIRENLQIYIPISHRLSFINCFKSVINNILSHQ